MKNLSFKKSELGGYEVFHSDAPFIPLMHISTDGWGALKVDKGMYKTAIVVLKDSLNKMRKKLQDGRVLLPGI